MEQVLVNLAVNARDAMPEGGRLVIEAVNVELDREYAHLHPESRPGPYLQLKVSDTGLGMDQETVERIFDPFFTTKSEGTGLGLATVYGIVTGGEGRIDVYSEPGLGTTVKVHLPASPSATEERTTAVGAPGAGHGEVILVVEDEPGVRRMAERILAKGGYSVISCADGAEAIARCARGAATIDLLLTDVVMPEMLGTTLVERVRSLRPGLPVLFMSGYSHAVLEPAALAADEKSEFIEKPFNARDLLSAVSALLDRAGPGETAA